MRPDAKDVFFQNFSGICWLFYVYWLFLAKTERKRKLNLDEKNDDLFAACADSACSDLLATGSNRYTVLMAGSTY